ncbi:putative germin-like protein 9-2 [Prunus yedoensis var. nudiflora]|uniref:Putative germin-like protein 9-2 n=1 Tax=Prunus yedoensis var. nudiflora TaxID=2094558 RepID=A0A314Y8R3_PRUYE|nr:putative germin-like protein 9-2 [Prunus yedoensis var. nudiflora]
MAGVPDIASDFIVAPTTTVDANFFTFTGMRAIVGGAPPTTFKVLKATLAEFPALNLNGQSVSYTVLQFPSGTTNLHTLILAPLSSSS